MHLARRARASTADGGIRSGVPSKTFWWRRLVRPSHITRHTCTATAEMLKRMSALDQLAAAVHCLKMMAAHDVYHRDMEEAVFMLMSR